MAERSRRLTPRPLTGGSVRSLCGPQARLRTEQPVAGNEITARWQKGARSAVPPPGGPKLIGPRACVQARRARNNQRKLGQRMDGPPDANCAARFRPRSAKHRLARPPLHAIAIFHHRLRYALGQRPTGGFLTSGPPAPSARNGDGIAASRKRASNSAAPASTLPAGGSAHMSHHKVERTCQAK
jgi:hypothetical protein